MPETAARLPCPVCLGVKMERTPVGDSGALVLDHCGRCGGVWFDAGEVDRLRTLKPQALYTRIGERAEADRMRCHDCHTVMPRSAARCPACGWRNVLHCPTCDRPMERTRAHGLTLDACRACRGVWFDHAELASVWNLKLSTAPVRGSGGELAPAAADAAGGFLFDIMIFAPDVAVHGAGMAAHGIAGAAGALGNAPEAAVAAAEAAGDAAASVFEIVAGILGDLFS